MVLLWLQVMLPLVLLYGWGWLLIDWLPARKQRARARALVAPSGEPVACARADTAARIDDQQVSK